MKLNILLASVINSVKTQGFFFLEGFGFPKEKLDYLQAVSQAVLDLPLEEKEEYSAGALQSEDDSLADTTKFGAERGTGFKVRGYWAMQNNVRDQIEHYNFVSSHFYVLPRTATDQIFPSLA